MPKILENPSHTAQLRKYGHDLSKVRKFSSSCGQLLPVYYDLASPGDKYRLNTEMFTQVTDLVSPAMMHVTEYVDWFFVPIKHIFQFADDSLFGISDFNTTLISGSTVQSSTNSVIPMFDANDMHDDINDVLTNYQDIQGLITDAVQELQGGLDEFGIPHFFNLQRLAELLGFGRKFALGADFSTITQDVILVNPMLACAYQKIFMDCYRKSNWTPNDPSSYNLDKYYNSTVPAAVAQGFFKMRYRPYAKDFFSLTMPSPLVDYSDVGMQGGYNQTNRSLTLFNNWLNVGRAINSNADLNATQVKDLSVTGENGNINSRQVNTSLLRGMFAVEKLMEITRRAEKHYNAQVLAHFGAKVPEGISDHVYRVGSEKSVLQVNEVIASAASTNGVQATTLGEKGGRAAGYASAGRNIEFKAPCHGILMAVYSCEPEADYIADGLDRINSYNTRYDFFQPELDKLGMQPIFQYQCRWQFAPSPNSNVLGWQYRYQELKLKYNDTLGAFNIEPYVHWSVHKENASQMLPNNPDYYYVPPYMLDDVLLLSFAYSTTDAYNYEGAFFRDPLLHWFKFNVYKSSVMSTYSLPDL